MYCINIKINENDAISIKQYCTVYERNNHAN